MSGCMIICRALWTKKSFLSSMSLVFGNVLFFIKELTVNLLDDGVFLCLYRDWSQISL